MFKFWKKRHRVVLPPTRLLLISDTEGPMAVRPDPELYLWLYEYRGTYEYGLDRSTAARWIEFDSLDVAVACKLTFG